jgi:prepilin-type N-terminal cleavage/methylation domain-containing protein
MRQKETKQGFTIIEFIIAIAVFAIVVVGLSSFQTNVFKLADTLDSGLKTQNEARRVLKPFANEARSASSSDSGTYALEETGDTSFVFYSDIDSDGSKERVRYYLDGNQIKKGIIESSGSPATYNLDDEIITDFINNVITTEDIFIYYDGNYNGTTMDTPLTQPVSPSDVKLIKVSFEVDEDVNRPPAAVTITTQASFRNLKDNL